MKKTFDILPLSPTQWVLVDKLADIPPGSVFLVDGQDIFDNKGTTNMTEPYTDNWLILAAYPKIEGVLLLPSLLWEKQKPAVREWAGAIYTLFAPHNVVDLVPEEKEELMSALKSTLEAAGGYTKEQMEASFQAGVSYDHNDKAPTSNPGIDFDEFISSLDNASPRALEIDVNEDGSIPSDNGVIIYNKAIY